MIQSEYLFKALAERGIHFFAGVPDSLLKDFCAYVPTMLMNRIM